MAFAGKRKLLMVLPGLLLMSASFSSLPAGADVGGCSTFTEPVALPAEAGQGTPTCSFPIFGAKIVVRGHVDGIGLVGMTIAVNTFGGGFAGSCGPVLNACDTVVSTPPPFGAVELATVICTWTGVVAINAHVSCDAESV